MRSKLDQLKEHMHRGNYKAALKIANSFAQLGAQRDAIQRGWAALQNAKFYTSIGKDPATLVVAGVQAICTRYELPPVADIEKIKELTK